MLFGIRYSQVAEDVQCIELHVFMVDQGIALPAGEGYAMDSLSLEAAKEFLTSSESDGKDCILKKFVDSFDAPGRGADQAGAEVVEIGAPPAPAIDWLQWRLMLKLGATCFLFSYNRYMSTQRQSVMIGE
jgi:hypothetical protein